MLITRSIHKQILLSLILIVLSFNITMAQQPDEIRITGNFRNVPLSDFLQTLEKSYGVKVFYKLSWVDDYVINSNFNDNTLDRALNSIFIDHELTYEIFQDNSVIVFPRRMDTRATLDDNGQILDVIKQRP